MTDEERQEALARVPRREDGKLLPGAQIGIFRKPGIEKRVRELVDFDKITLALQAIALGQMPEGVTMSPPKVSDQIKAAALLYDRGFGKPRIMVDIQAEITDGVSGIDIDQLDDEAFARLERTMAKALSRASESEAKLEGFHKAHKARLAAEAAEAEDAEVLDSATLESPE